MSDQELIAYIREHLPLWRREYGDDTWRDLIEILDMAEKIIKAGETV